MPRFGCKAVALMQKDERTCFANPDFPEELQDKEESGSWIQE